MGDSFKDLLVWQRAIQLTVSIYKFTADFPSTEQFGLTNQLRRSAVSIASNIAEGYGRRSRGEYLQFLGIARGAVCELQTQLVIAAELNLGRQSLRAKSDSLSVEVSRMLIAMMKKLSN